MFSFILLLITVFICGCQSTSVQRTIASKKERLNTAGASVPLTCVRPPEKIYIVRKGDTLWSISQKYNTTVGVLLHRNGLSKHDTLIIGQKIFIPFKDENKQLFLWPVKGKITAYFGEMTPGGISRGIEFALTQTKKIRAASDGQVTFSSETASLGNTVIVRHLHEIYTVYGNLSELFVHRGDYVSASQPLGELTPRGGKNAFFHFEIRDALVPRDPLTFLSESSL